MNPRAEEVRIRYLYRRLVLRGKARIPHEAARKIMGPDCAYHLYSRYGPVKQVKGKRGGRGE